MTDKIIIFKNTDGSCGVLHPTQEALKTMTIEEIAQKDIPLKKDFRVALKKDLPKDRYFRGAWTDDKPGEQIDVDLEKAQVIQMAHIRAKRNKKLQDLDIETMKGKDVQVEKQKLRDIPAIFDLSKAKTPEELKALWPKELEE